MNNTALCVDQPCSDLPNEEFQIVYKSTMGDDSVFLVVSYENTRPQSSLSAAVSLGEVESACVFLESALQTHLNFEEFKFNQDALESPVSNSTDHHIRARLQLLTAPDTLDSGALKTVQKNTPKIEVFLPSGVLSKLSEDLFLPGKTKDINVEWLPVKGTLRLANIDLSEDDKNRLGENSLLLIPESFRSDWQCAVELVGTDTFVSAKYDTDTQQIVSKYAFLPRSNNRFLQVYAQQQVDVCLASMLSAHTHKNINAFDPVTVDHCRCVCADGKRFDARLLSVGNGFGISLLGNTYGTH